MRNFMLSNLKPTYLITPTLANLLMRIEAAKENVASLPLTPTVLSSLRESARLYTTHYSTMIEGNRLEPEQIRQVIEHKGHFPGRERDEQEVMGYYAALAQLEQYVAQRQPLTENLIQTLHALVMSNGRVQGVPTPYRDGQNVIRDGATGRIVYMPPEAKDVPALMERLVFWIREQEGVPVPIVAAIAHYQFATIHPYYDGNGRTARLLTTFILHRGGYDLKGLYSLEEYYAKNLFAYYTALTVGPSHNYYMGRAEADITGWVEYFCTGMAIACEHVIQHMTRAQMQGDKDHSVMLRTLDPKQRRALELFKNYDVVRSSQIGQLFGYKPRTSSALCASWVDMGFLEIVDQSKKARSYRLAAHYRCLLEG